MMDYLADRFAPGAFFGWLCLALLATIPLVWLRASGRKTRPTVRFSSLEPFAGLAHSFAARTRFVIPLLRTAAILALIVALARPQAGGELRDIREGIAIQMVLDVSGSMAEQDFVLDGKPVRRLDAVKKVFRDFVLGEGSLSGRENDLIGMTTFAMYPDTSCPLTLDHGSLIDLLGETEIPGWVQGRQVREQVEAGYTGLGEAIVLASDDLRRAGEQALAGVPGSEAAKSRVMILLTDGKDNPAKNPTSPPPDPLEAARVAANLGIKVYTIGAVGSGSPQRRGMNLIFQPRAEFDEETLKGIAKATGAKYFRATDVESLITIYEEIGRLETRRTGERSFHDNIWAAQVAMMMGLGLLGTELLLVNTRYRRVP